MHWLPIEPQLFGSDESTTHCPPLRVAPGGQMHAPLMQASPPVQRLPHAPQLFGSIERSAQLVPHMTVPVAQMHAPALHVEPAPQR